MNYVHSLDKNSPIDFEKIRQFSIRFILSEISATLEKPSCFNKVTVDSAKLRLEILFTKTAQNFNNDER